jgi:antibiotic biosynthesis monooxygenase (ABM) superfamily enzyme
MRNEVFPLVKLQSDHENQITSVICRDIKSGHEKDYDNWARRYLTFERKAPGYLGTTIIIPGGSKSSLRYIIRRFKDKATMEAWDNSEESQKLLQEADNYSTRHYETSTGFETWFTVPGLKTLSQSPPPKWKMAIVIFSAAYLISSLSHFILNPFLNQWPLLANSVIFTGILVVSLTYFAMPLLNRILRRWLYIGSV